MKDVLVHLATLRDALISAKQTETSLQSACDLVFAIGTELMSDRRTTETESDLATDILGQISSGLDQLREGNQPILALARADTTALISAIEKRMSDLPKRAKATLRMDQPLLMELPPILSSVKSNRVREPAKR
jgi:hypothetical protein